VLGKKIKDWQQDICEKCRCRRHSPWLHAFVVHVSQRQIKLETTSWPGLFGEMATFSWKDWRRKKEM